jgi:hypothetical protein
MADKITTRWIDRPSGSPGERPRSRQFRVDIWHRDDGWLYMLVDRPPEWIGPFTTLEAATDAARARDAEARPSENRQRS